MIFLIRHGQTRFNREGRLQGRLDSELTELGIEQARRMGRILRDFVEDPGAWSMISSPLRRAQHTAEIVREETGLSCLIELDHRITEVSGGEWEGLTRDEILARRPDVDGGLSGRDMLMALGGEDDASLDRRLSAWLADLDEADGRRRIVVSHRSAGHRLRQLYAGVGRDVEPPPQDAVFLLHRGVVGRVDEGWEG